MLYPAGVGRGVGAGVTASEGTPSSPRGASIPRGTHSKGVRGLAEQDPRHHGRTYAWQAHSCPPLDYTTTYREKHAIFARETGTTTSVENSRTWAKNLPRATEQGGHAETNDRSRLGRPVPQSSMEPHGEFVPPVASSSAYQSEVAHTARTHGATLAHQQAQRR